MNTGGPQAFGRPLCNACLMLLFGYHCCVALLQARASRPTATALAAQQGPAAAAKVPPHDILLCYNYKC
jgi:hypothetical protein